jgi:hypothetical protein
MEVKSSDAVIGAVDRHHESQNQDQSRIKRYPVPINDAVHPDNGRTPD